VTAHSINRYKTDLRELRFLLFELFSLDDLFGKPPYADWDRESAEMVLSEVYDWAREVLGPLNAVGDQQGCTLEGGQVTTPDGFKEAWKSLAEAGWRNLTAPEEYGGSEAPFALGVVTGEMLSGANTSFNMYPGLTDGVAEVLHAFGTDEQKKKYLPGLHDGTYAGTMCLTEPHAGSDVGAASTRAIRLDDGTYRIEGTKVFISAGDHDLTDNILHLVLARTEDAAVGTRGLSLFIVAKNKPDGSSNGVKTVGLEHKMGINGSATAQLAFEGDCTGELVGTEEQQGMRQMFKMMNLARIGVGIQGLAVAGSAYYNALDYARERKQGPSIKNWKDAAAPKVPIIEHPDVRRMLLDMKARVEGIRALIVKLAVHVDRQRAAELGGDEKAVEYHKGQIDLLVPVVKAYASDQGFQVSATAIQVFGGAGYLTDHPVEQYCRDAKIFSIYEGTNHIQALDLVGRKLGNKGGANFQAYLADVNRFVGDNMGHPVLRQLVAKLGEANAGLMSAAMRFYNWFRRGNMELVPLNANRFLEMLARTTVAWMLLEAAVVAHQKADGLEKGTPEHDFYLGKRYAAQYYCLTELPLVAQSAQVLEAESRGPLEIPDGGFGC
jgi:hypothetical protein